MKKVFVCALALVGLLGGGVAAAEWLDQSSGAHDFKNRWNENHRTLKQELLWQ